MLTLPNTFVHDCVEIPFDNDWKKISISLSGGADSALLAFILCNYINNLSLPTKIHIISHIRCWKTKPWQEYDSLNIFNWLNMAFPNLSFKRHVNFIPPELEWGDIGPTIVDEYNKKVSGDILELRSYSEYIIFKENIDAYFNAVNRNPKHTNFRGMDKRDIEVSNSNKHLSLMIHMGKVASHPFRFIEKDWIIKQYLDLKLLTLLELTRSCEGEFKDIDYTTYTSGQYVPICGNCFWCKERAWAIEQSK